MKKSAAVGKLTFVHIYAVVKAHLEVFNIKFEKNIIEKMPRNYIYFF